MHLRHRVLELVLLVLVVAVGALTWEMYSYPTSGEITAVSPPHEDGEPRRGTTVVISSGSLLEVRYE